MNTSIFERCRKIIATTLIVTIISSFTPITFAATHVNSLTVSSQVGTLTAGTAGSATFLVTITGNGSGGLVVTPNVSGLPGGVSGSFSPATVSINNGTSAQTTLTVNTTIAAVAGSSTITVANNDNAITGTATLTIGAAPDNTAPVISETSPVPTPTSDNTPNYTFTTDEAGTITYGGDCSSATTAAVV